jgi:long-chain acyl-CoA synthetase
VLDTAAIDFPDRIATSFLGATLTFRDIKERSDRLAAALGGLGITQGDRVGIMLPNCPQYFLAVFAILRHGAVVVNINPTYTEREVRAMALDSGIRVLLTLDTLLPLAAAVQDGTPLEMIVITSLDEYAPAAAPPAASGGALRLHDLLNENQTPAIIRVRIAPDDVAVLQYTGGTTGTSKGAMLTHASLFANVIQNEAVLYRPVAPEAPRYVMVIPFFHIYAFTVGIMTGLWVGALQVLIPKYDVEQLLTAIRDYQPTYVPAVPTVFVSILNHPRAREYGLDRVRYYNSGGAPCSVEVIEQFERAFGRPLNEGYGLTETSPVTHFTPYLAERRIGTVGLPLPDTDLKVVDAETGTRELPPGEAGELCIAGPQVMKGYWNRPDETANALRVDEEGRTWFYTGDIARIDDDGFTSIVQRKKDMILVDGFNVYPSEVETVLYMHPGVRLAAVVAMPDRYHGEVVKACVVLKDGSRATCEELIAHCTSSLAPYKIPRLVEIRESLPTSAVGKILHRVLRDEARTSSQS